MMEEQEITITKKLKKPPGFFELGCFCALTAQIISHFSSAQAAEISGIGPVLDRFNLTLEAGYRTEAAGPFFYSETKDSETTWAIPPFFSGHRDSATESQEEDFLYPLFTHIRYGQEQRWQFVQLLSLSSGQEQGVDDKKRFTLFPFYFQQRSPDTNLNYTAVFPFYGHLKDRLFRDEMFFVMFPIYGETRKHDVVTENYLYPFVHVRHGDGLNGWQVWPVVGSEHKDVTTSTNGFGDVSLVAGHDKSFFLWPLWLKQDSGTGTENPEKFRASIPFYASTRSPQRGSTSVLWPLFTWIDERGKKYHEWQGPWPLVIFTRGEGKTTSRVFPLFSESRNAVKESDSYLWPLYVYHRTHAGSLDQKKTRVLFYLYSKTTEQNTQTGVEKRRLDMWPFFTWHRDFNGNERLQVLAPLEPVLPNNRGIERNWSPLWSFWRAEDNAKTGAASRSLLWNLYRRDTAPAHKKVSLLFGLFQYQSDGETRQTRWFYFTVSKTSPPAK
jgi:hypothetical protein